MADDAPVRAALLGRGPDRDRWRAWLSAAGVQVVLCDHLAAAAALVPRPSVVVVDTAALDAAEGGGAIDPVGVPVVLLDDLVAGPMGSGPATRLSRTASRAASAPCWPFRHQQLHIAADHQVQRLGRPSYALRTRSVGTPRARR